MSIELQERVRQLERWRVGLTPQIEELERLVAEVQDALGAFSGLRPNAEPELDRRMVTLETSWGNMLTRLGIVEDEQRRRRPGRPPKPRVA